MEPKLFDIKEGRVIPTEHCYTINSFRNVIDEYGDNAGKVFAVIHYLYSLNPKTNPYALVPELGKKEKVIASVCPELDLNNDVFALAFEEGFSLYNSGPRRAFLAYKNLIDKVISELNTTNVSLNKTTGNMQQIAVAIKSHKDLEQAYNSSFEKYMSAFDEDKTLGGSKRSYDDDINDDDDEDDDE